MIDNNQNSNLSAKDNKHAKSSSEMNKNTTHHSQNEDTKFCDSRAGKFSSNAIAISIAELLCEGKTKAEIADLLQMINVLASAIRTYIV